MQSDNEKKKPLTQVEFARLGGIARSKKLSPRQRSEICRKAARARWAAINATRPSKHRTPRP
jgi:hypothetical protein